MRPIGLGDVMCGLSQRVEAMLANTGNGLSRLPIVASTGLRGR